ncbi:MAG: hypothetical protein QOE53_949, partial [Pseudonocardiales bacterium]|nr:hypothetical protein [Pseudonocardiales bacterium]
SPGTAADFGPRSFGRYLHDCSIADERAMNLPPDGASHGIPCLDAQQQRTASTFDSSAPVRSVPQQTLPCSGSPANVALSASTV